MTAALALAFTAGLVATVNPCGIAMLPAYVSYFVGAEGDDDPGTALALLRAVKVGAVVSLGFLVVFGFAGLLVSFGVRQVIDLIPWAALVVGGAIVLLGLAMLAGYEPKVTVAVPGQAAGSRRISTMFLFGVSYAVASLSCTLPIFLVVVAGTIPALSVLGGVAVFLVYGLGMSLVLVVLTIAVALGRRALVRWIRGSARWVNRVAGVVLVVAGGYVAAFWATNLARGPLEPSALTVRVEQVASRLANSIGGSPLLWGAGAATIIVAASLYAWHAARAAGHGDGT